MEVSSPTLMVVVVDQTNEVYAYSKQEVDLDGEPVTFPIVFRTWRRLRHHLHHRRGHAGHL